MNILADSEVQIDNNIMEVFLAEQISQTSHPQQKSTSGQRKGIKGPLIIEDRLEFIYISFISLSETALYVTLE